MTSEPAPAAWAPTPEDPAEPAPAPEASAEPALANPAPPSLRRLAPYLRPYWPHLAGIAAISLLSTAVGLAVPLAAKVLVDEVGVANRPDRLLPLGVTLFVLGLLAMGMRSAGQALHAWTTAHVLFDVRLALFRRLIRMTPEYLAARRGGDLLSRLTADVAEAQSALSDGTLGLALAGLAAFASAIALFWLSWKLAVVSILVAPWLVASVLWLRPRALAIARDLREQASDAMAFLSESLFAIQEIQAFGLDRRMADRYADLNRRFVSRLMRQQALGAVAEALPALCLGAGTLAVLALGAGLIQAGEFTWGGLVAFLAYQWRFQGPLRGLSALWLRLQRARVALGRVLEIADLTAVLRPGGDPVPARLAGADLELDAVSYHFDGREAGGSRARDSDGYLGSEPDDYSGHKQAGGHRGLEPDGHRDRKSRAHQVQASGGAPRPVPSARAGESSRHRVPGGGTSSDRGLTNVSAIIRGGSITAIVGPSGAGKSTLIRLLLRLLEPSAGRILAGGMPIAALDGDAWRLQLAVVGQDTFLFHDTLVENVRLARPEATEAEILEAIRAAGLQPVIDRLPDGLATVVGERGTRLSGGERQRVSLARALLRRPPLLILDEATAALDPLTEEAVWETLARRRERGATTLLVTHRIGTALRADDVLVLDRGRLVQSGSPGSLAACPGPFADLLAAWSAWPDAPGQDVRPPAPGYREPSPSGAAPHRTARPMDQRPETVP